MTYNRADVDLTNCDREPIHIPGSIQPHGAMFVVDPASATVTFASANIQDYVGVSIPERFASVPVVRKPITARSLANEFSLALAQ